MDDHAQDDRGLVTVVTATRRRPNLLLRAIDSVTRQCCNHVAAHIVLVDDCQETWAALGKELPLHVWPRMVLRRPGEMTGPRRLAALRDLGARLANTPWIAYIDDDNQWLPSHLHELLDTAAASGSRAVYSWMRVVWPDGRPYVEPEFPWARTREIAREKYCHYQRLGVMDAGSNIYRDRADEHEGENSVRTVDGGEWLLETELVRSIGFSFDFTANDEEAMIGEDDKFLYELIARRIKTACTRSATLIYQLGGFSTSMDGPEPVSWR